MSRAVVPDHLFVSPQRKWTADELMDPANMAIACEKFRAECARNAMTQVRALMAAGWQFEVAHENAAEPWQWAWRRPPRRRGSSGMRFASTNQAYSALLRSQTAKDGGAL